MGRLKKYLTDQEKKEAANAASKKYYWKNKKKIDQLAKLRYKNNKDELYIQTHKN